MTDDKTLLELAAKAAGYDGLGVWDDKWQCLTDHEGWTFNPLTNDGDALRLAVKLNIPVIPYDDETSTGTVGVVAKNWSSKEENTRRAIVRAAAEIGRAMG